ncbi:MAG: hypothetical protein IJ242_12555, partial [Clostridia bacterium]|nr:hypothetical protein [Clostridia bacterium]
IRLGKVLHKAFAQTGAKAVDIPRNKLHDGQSSLWVVVELCSLLFTTGSEYQIICTVKDESLPLF